MGQGKHGWKYQGQQVIYEDPKHSPTYNWSASEKASK